MASVGLARESSAVAEKELAYEYQIERLKSYGCTWVYGDRVSGTREDRRGLDDALAKIKSGEANELVVTHLTRLGRSVLTINKVIELLKSHGAKLTVLGGAIDISTPEGRSFLQIQAVWGQYEAELGAERQKIGWENSQNKARPRAPVFGYLIKDGRYEPDNEARHCDGRSWNNWELALEILGKVEELRSVNAVHRWLHQEYGWMQSQPRPQRPPFTYRGLRNWLGNPVLIGHIVFKSGVRHLNQHTPLMNTEKQQRFIQMNTERCQPGVRIGDRRYAYSGLVICAECQTKCVQKTSGSANTKKKYLHYQCPKTKLGLCSNKKLTRDTAIHGALMQALGDQSKAIAQGLRDIEFPKSNPKILELQDQIARLLPVAAIDDRIKATIVDIELEIQNLQAQPTPASKSQIEDDLKIIEAIQDPPFWANLSGRKQGDYLRLLIRQILVKDAAVVQVVFQPRFSVFDQRD
jgi:DNA invertase Pin-like site-specific DNA recombinase